MDYTPVTEKMKDKAVKQFEKLENNTSQTLHELLDYDPKLGTRKKDQLLRKEESTNEYRYAHSLE